MHNSRTAYRILTSNRYSREKPTLPAHIQRVLRSESASELFLLWGGSKESPSGRVDEADREALEHLSGLAGETKELLKGATALEICVLFCDTHHQVANGKDRDACRQYGNDIRSLALTYDLSFVFLSDSYTAGVPCTSNIASHLEHIGDPALREKTQTLFRQEAFRKKATDASAKHSQLVKRGTSAEVAARLYTLIELDFLTQLQRPERVFASYSDPAIQRPIAEATPVPMLYLHSSGPGHHACPWYVAKS